MGREIDEKNSMVLLYKVNVMKVLTNCRIVVNNFAYI